MERVINFVHVGGNPLSDLNKRCIKSWQEHLPNYKIKQWDETNFDVSSNKFCKQALECGAYAFASDYMRLKTIYDNGGIYMDTDVEVTQNFDKFLDCPAFIGLETPPIRMASCVIGAKKKSTFVENWLSFYNDASFIGEDGALNLKPNTHTITEISHIRYPRLKLNDTIERFSDLTVFPVEYFSPFNRKTQELNATENTHAIHRFAGSWLHFREMQKLTTADKTK